MLDSYLRRKPHVNGFPLELAIELTNHCNVDCIMCPRKKMTRKKGFMDFNLFRKIIDEAKAYTELSFLHLAGESLLHPELKGMIDYCGQCRIDTALSTNAVLLNEEKSEELLKSPLNLLILSFDGTTKETYEKIRRHSDFENTYANIQRLLEIKSKLKKSPYTVIQLIYMKDNVKEVKDFILKWKKSKVDAVRVKPYLNYPGLDNYLGELPQRKGKHPKPCILLWRQLAIYWDGTAVSCCQDFLSQMEVGDVKRDSIKDIWNSQAMMHMRKIHLDGGYQEIPLCRDCTMPQLNPFLLLGTIFFDDLTIKKILPKIEEFVILRNMHNISYFS